uniref:Uncharacterized protein n=1 Tax=Arundo donax TaxID=35708 RepID=A0A0A9BJ05_ARUDO
MEERGERSQRQQMTLPTPISLSS